MHRLEEYVFSLSVLIKLKSIQTILSPQFLLKSIQRHFKN